MRPLVHTWVSVSGDLGGELPNPEECIASALGTCAEGDLFQSGCCGLSHLVCTAAIARPVNQSQICQFFVCLFPYSVLGKKSFSTLEIVSSVFSS